MELHELCSLQSTSPSSGRVPGWTLGCFKRRSITFFNGESDDTTLVVWMQSRGLTCDLRLPAERPRPASRDALLELPLAELLRLCEVEGGASPTRFEPDAVSGVELSGTMHWPDWTAFQLHAKWPEPGNLRRVGDCLLEYAPSGAYVEDWRLQSSNAGPLVGLSLLEERDHKSGSVLHRGGGLVIAGDHALFVRGRAEALPPAARLSELCEQATREPRLLDAIFGFEASYAQRDAGGHYVVLHSTLPWREGKLLMGLGGFTVHDDEIVVQKSREHGRSIERRFQIDTLEPSYEDWLATPATSAAAAWLAAEESLLRAARKL
jgi:hypothetical protein